MEESFMKVAIFDNSEEVIILAVKGRGKGFEIDGFNEWFEDRDVEEYDVTLAHIGSGEGIQLTTEIKTNITSVKKCINEWFDPQPEEEAVEE